MRILIIGSFLLIPWLCQAQVNWNKVVDQKFDSGSFYWEKNHAYDATIFQDSLILFTAMSRNGHSCAFGDLIAYNMNSREFRQTIHQPTNLLINHSASISTFGIHSGESDIGGDHALHFMELNNNLQVVKSHYFDMYYYAHDDNLWNLEHQLPNGFDRVNDLNIVTFDEVIIKHNYADSTLESFKTNFNDTLGKIHAINPNIYVVQAGRTIFTIDSSFNYIDTQQFNESTIDIQLINDTIHVLTEFEIIRFNDRLEILDTIFTSNESIQSLTADNSNEVWVTLRTNEQNRLINIQNHTEIIVPKYMNQNKYIFHGNEVIAIGESFSNQIGFFSIQNNSRSDEGTPISDIELIDFDITITSTNASGYSTYDATFELRNTGDDTIQNFALLAEHKEAQACINLNKYFNFNNLLLLPNATQSFDIEDLFYYNGLPNFGDICYAVKAPNSELELNVSNNKVCKDYNLTDISELCKNTVQVYPNPANNILQIQHEFNEPVQLAIYDLNGKLALKAEPKSNATIDIEQLASGVYQLQITTANAVYSQKLIKN